MAVTVDRTEPSHPVLHASGDIDMTSAPELTDVGMQALDTGEPSGVTVDLAAVTFIDSSGLSALIALNRHARQSGRSFALRAVPPAAERVLSLTGLGTVFRTEE